MKDDCVKALMIGDIVGQSGLRAIFLNLRELIKKHSVDFVVANGENAAGGFGLTEEICEQLFAQGVDVITSGNHIWQKREIFPYLDSSDRVLRPANYPQGAPGKGWTCVDKRGIKWGIINLQGRDELYPIECPFRVAKETIKRLRGPSTVILVDFHAESTGEKEALGLYLDGEIAAISGTHTHVQTSDLRVLPKGTGYVTDLGMTGPEASCIGVKPEISLGRCLTQIPLKMETAEGDAELSAVLYTIDPKNGLCLSASYAD